MPTYDYDLGVIGGGAAGLTVTSGAAQLGAKVLLIEREPQLGGDCLHFGCVPSKTLIKTAAVYHQMQKTKQYGLPEIEIPPVDFTSVARRIRNVIETIQPHDSPERFCKLGAEVKFGHAEFTDQHTVRIGDKETTAKQWLIATGSSPAIPKIRNLSQVPYLTNREIFSLEKLPESLIIIGGGSIAVEMAQAFCRLGSRVEIIQRSGQILSREDKDMADLIMARLQEEGVIFHLNTTLKEARNLGARREIIYFDKNGREVSVQGEQLLVAMGRTPNVDNMGLNTIDLALGSRGIDVDSRLRTKHKHIYAAGDVTGAYQFTHAAGYEGGIVISNAIFKLPRKTNYTLMPWCTYTEPELASIGMNEKTAQKTGIEHTVWSENFSDNDRSLAEGERIGKIKLILNKKERPIGVQILGPHGGDLIGEWVAAMNGNLKLATIASAIHPYPTLTEINKRVAGKVFSQKLFSPKIRKTLSFLFGFRGKACQ